MHSKRILSDIHIVIVLIVKGFFFFKKKKERKTTIHPLAFKWAGVLGVLVADNWTDQWNESVLFSVENNQDPSFSTKTPKNIKYGPKMVKANIFLQAENMEHHRADVQCHFITV